MNTVIIIIVLLTKKTVDADYSALNKEIGTNPKSPKFTFSDRVRIISYRDIFSKSW